MDDILELKFEVNALGIILYLYRIICWNNKFNDKEIK